MIAAGVTAAKDTMFATGPKETQEATDVYNTTAVADAAKPTASGGEGVAKPVDTSKTIPSTASESAAKEESSWWEFWKDDEENADQAEGSKAVDKGADVSAEDSEQEEAEWWEFWKDDEAKENKDPTIKEKVEAGTSESEIKNGLADKKGYPPSVDVVDFATSTDKWSPDQVSGAVDGIYSKMTSGEAQTLLTADLSSYANTLLGFIDKLGLSGLLCPAEEFSGDHVDDAFKIGKLKIDIRKNMLCNKGKPTMDLGLAVTSNEPIAARDVLTESAIRGNFVTLQEANSFGKDNGTPGFKDSLVGKTLGGYKKSTGETNEETDDKAGMWLDGLASVATGWNTYDREGESADKPEAYKTASNDSKELLRRNENTQAGSLVADTYCKDKPTANQAINQKYPTYNAQYAA